MKRAAFTLGCLLTLAAPVSGQSLRNGAMVVQQTEAIVTVMRVNVDKRTVTIRDAKGKVTTLVVPEESQNLDKVKRGARFKIKFIEAVAVGISKGNDPMQSENIEVKFAPKGGTPGAMVTHTERLSVVVDEVDYVNRYIAVRAANGETRRLKVVDEIPLQQFIAGDEIAVAYTHALIAEMQPTPASRGAKQSVKKPAESEKAPK